MTVDKATIINWALTDIGAGPIFSIDDDTDLAEQIEATWQRTVDRVFGMHDWTFSKVTRKNRLLVDPPEIGWQYQFDLPGDRIGNPLAYLRAVVPQPVLIRNFALQEGRLFCNEPVSYSIVKVAVDPSAWDPVFRSAFVTVLAGSLAVPVWMDEDMRDRKLAEAFGTPSMQGTGGTIGRLMAQDKGASPIGDQPLLANDPLTDAHSVGRGEMPWYGRM